MELGINAGKSEMSSDGGVMEGTNSDEVECFGDGDRE